VEQKTLKTKTVAALKITLSFLLVLVSWTSTSASTLDKRESDNPQSSFYSVERIVVGGATEFRFNVLVESPASETCAYLPVIIKP
jgi:hypothetical protein